MSRFVNTLVIVLQLGFVLFAIRLYHIEELSGFARIAPWIFGAFVIHAWLPRAMRMPLFLLLSLVSIQLILGTALGAVLIALGLTLFGICHLPLRFRLRVLLLLLAGAALAAVRAGWIVTPWPNLPTFVLPILGAMFMFRLAIYLYDLRNERGEVSVWQRLAYFFMVPNVCFPLFPVIDYQTFKRTWYDGESWQIYQKGVLWIVRGILQLLAYRVVYHHLVPPPVKVTDLYGVVLFVVTTYALYLRISGQFHLIVGVLHLFGFNLPETHRRYFLASSFTDYWRRINIYWKDFMTKMVFYPVFMGLRRMGTKPGLAVATVIVFLCTWLLHSYQWFWIRGSFPLRAADGAFWGALGLLVLVNTLRDAGRGGKAASRGVGWSFGAALALSLRTLGMFVTVSVLWSVWCSESPADWWATVRHAADAPASQFVVVLVALAAVVLAGTLAQALAARGLTLSVDSRTQRAAAAWTLATMTLLVVAGLPQVQARLGSRPAELIASLQSERLSRQDEELLQRGYYESLLDEGTLTSGLWQAQVGKPKDWVPIANSRSVRNVQGILEYVLIPSFDSEVKRARFSTNRFGMRDTEYTQAKPERTFRIALLGSSQIMGAGVENDRTFDPILEGLLNRELAGPDRRFEHYEVLNFAVGGYSAIQSLVVAERKAAPFEPDLLVYIVHSTEKRRLTTNLFRALQSDDHDFDFDFVRERVERSGAAPTMARAEVRRRLEPAYDEIISWSLAGIAAAGRDMGARSLLVFAPTPNDDAQGLAYGKELLRAGRELGFETLDLTDAYDGVSDPRTLTLAPWDRHPNATGHRLLAQRAFERLLDHPELLGLDEPSGPGEERSL